MNYIKKNSLVLALLVLCLFVSACGKESAGSKNKATAESNAPSCSQQTIKALIEKNIDCYCMFKMSPVSHTDEKVENGYYKCNTNFFKSFSDFDDFIRSVYCEKKADELIYSYPNSEAPLYKVIDGKLCVNTELPMTDAEYYVTWDDGYTVDIKSCSESKCDFSLKTTIVKPNEKEKSYTTEGSAVYEYGYWRLCDFVA